MSQTPKDILARGAVYTRNPAARMEELVRERAGMLRQDLEDARRHLAHQLLTTPKSIDELQPYSEAERLEAMGKASGTSPVGSEHPLSPYIENPEDALVMVVGAKCSACGRTSDNARLRRPDGTVAICPMPFVGPAHKFMRAIPCRACGEQMFLELEPVPEGAELVNVDG